MIPHLVLIAPCFRVMDPVTAEPASTSTNVTGHQVVFNKCPLG